MATVTIENARVERIIAGYGFKVTERVMVLGEERTNWITVWTKETAKEGDILTIEGELSVKLEEYVDRNNEQKQVAAVHVNNALIMPVGVEDAPF